jgi:hypothetical protein
MLFLLDLIQSISLSSTEKFGRQQKGPIIMGKDMDQSNPISGNAADLTYKIYIFN